MDLLFVLIYDRGVLVFPVKIRWWLRPLTFKERVEYGLVTLVSSPNHYQYLLRFGCHYLVLGYFQLDNVAGEGIK